MTTPAPGGPTVPLTSLAGRWVIVATVLGSGMAFLDGTVVNIALPTISRELGGGLVVQQWVLDGYLLTLSALLLLGGALGDRYGRRRVFAVGLVAFAVASLLCGLAPTGGVLIAARLLQGIGGALLVPGSLALINAAIRTEDRGRAVGTWAGLAGVASALGPFVGGWLVDAASWRWVFLINLPLAAVAVWVTARHVPESRNPDVAGRLDIGGALAVTIGLAGLTYALIEGPGRGWNGVTVTAAVVGGLAMLAFPVIEARMPEPLLPIGIFRSSQFTGANLATFAIYGALGGALFLLALQLQQTLGYSALAAGVAMLPITVVMMALSSRMGALAQRIGPRIPMTVGPFVAAGGFGLMSLVQPGAGYWTVVFPAVVVFAFGLTITVAPLTAAVLASAEEKHMGAASGVNNALSRLSGLVAVAVLPPLAGVNAGHGALGPGFGRAMLISAGVCAAGGLISFVTVRQSTPVEPHPVPAVNAGCQDPCTRRPIGATEAQ